MGFTAREHSFVRTRGAPPAASRAGAIQRPPCETKRSHSGRVSLTMIWRVRILMAMLALVGAAQLFVSTTDDVPKQDVPPSAGNGAAFLLEAAHAQLVFVIALLALWSLLYWTVQRAFRMWQGALLEERVAR